jgi:hypothetical protein
MSLTQITGISACVIVFILLFLHNSSIRSVVAGYRGEDIGQEGRIRFRKALGLGICFGWG